MVDPPITDCIYKTRWQEFTRILWTSTTCSELYGKFDEMAFEPDEILGIELRVFFRFATLVASILSSVKNSF